MTLLGKGKPPGEPRHSYKDLVKRPNQIYWQHPNYRSRDVLGVLATAFSIRLRDYRLPMRSVQGRPRKRSILSANRDTSDGLFPLQLAEFAVRRGRFVTGKAESIKCSAETYIQRPINVTSTCLPKPNALPY